MCKKVSHHYRHGGIETYRSMGLDGEIGITIHISPTYPETESESDVAATRIEDGLQNRWFLDPILRGSYPEDIHALYAEHADLGIEESDIELIAANRPDFLGVNYCSPTRVRANPESKRFGVKVLPNPDEQPAFNGEVFPDGLFDALVRIDTEYDHPRIFITENGAGFGPEDDQITDGRVHDRLRQDYIKRHLLAAHQAIESGVKLERYYVWSCFDNFEWIFGYASRFGIVHVDFETQERIWKDSAFDFQSYIRQNGFDL